MLPQSSQWVSPSRVSVISVLSFVFVSIASQSRGRHRFYQVCPSRALLPSRGNHNCHKLYHRAGSRLVLLVRSTTESGVITTILATGITQPGVVIRFIPTGITEPGFVSCCIVAPVTTWTTSRTTESQVATAFGAGPRAADGAAPAASGVCPPQRGRLAAA